MAGTAIIHQAELNPSKLGMLDAWLQRQDWFDGTGPLSQIAYRFNDPEGEVGVETFIVTDAQAMQWQVPVTYRGAPLEGAEEALITTMQHSVLGERWVYDGRFDEVYRAELVRTIVTGDTNASLSTGLTPDVRAVGSGAEDEAPELVDVHVDDTGFGFADELGDTWRVEIARRFDDLADDLDDPDEGEVLTGVWLFEGQPRSAVLARLTRA